MEKKACLEEKIIQFCSVLWYFVKSLRVMFSSLANRMDDGTAEEREHGTIEHDAVLQSPVAKRNPSNNQA